MDQGVVDFQGWRGDGVTAPYFHNVRAKMIFGLPSAGTVRGLSYLALGGFGTVQTELTNALAKRPPFGTIDAPASGTTATFTAGAPLSIAGWVLDSAPVAAVSVEIDGAQVTTLPVSAPRSDVCTAYPKYRGCPNAGFAGSVPTTGLGPCPHLLRVIATDSDGNSRILGERVIQSS
jgi:hypothetical protein